jgi:predicted dehydrogenase
MTTPIKTGVFGVGSLGQWHARIYSELASADLIGVYDVDATRCAEIAARYDCRPFDSIEALAREIDAASVVVPTDLHLEMFEQLLPHNVHMLMEKPIAASLDEAAQMVAAARANQLLLQVGHVERFNPVMSYLEANLERPKFIEAERLATFPPAREGALPRGTEVSVVLDLMIHDLDVILHIANSPVKSIHATGVAVLSPTEDLANARIQFESGCVANVTASRVSMEQKRKIRVFQDDVYLSLDYMNQSGQLCRKQGLTIAAETVPIDRNAPLDAELAAFVDCVQHHRDPIVTGEHASRALELAVEICRLIKDDPS